MKPGPIPLRVVALLLGKDEKSMGAVIKQERLPTVPLTSGKNGSVCMYFNPLLDWINQRANNEPMTAEQLKKEIASCQEHFKALDKAKRERRAARAAGKEAA